MKGEGEEREEREGDIGENIKERSSRGGGVKVRGKKRSRKEELK